MQVGIQADFAVRESHSHQGLVAAPYKPKCCSWSDFQWPESTLQLLLPYLKLISPFCWDLEQRSRIESTWKLTPLGLNRNKPVGRLALLLILSSRYVTLLFRDPCLAQGRCVWSVRWLVCIYTFMQLSQYWFYNIIVALLWDYFLF